MKKIVLYLFFLLTTGLTVQGQSLDSCIKTLDSIKPLNRISHAIQKGDTTGFSIVNRMGYMPNAYQSDQDLSIPMPNKDLGKSFTIPIPNAYRKDTAEGRKIRIRRLPVLPDSTQTVKP